MGNVGLKLGVRPDIQKYQPRVFEKIPDLIRGTSLHDEYWERERDKCINGYAPKGMTPISGAHYFFLNHFPMKVNDPTASATQDRKVLSLPFYRDMDHVYFQHILECKADRTGAIVAKSRDKGFSMFNACLCLHELTFFAHNEVGVAAGLEDTITSFASKVKLGHNSLEKEFKNNISSNNTDAFAMGYDWWNGGQWEEGGMQSIMHLRTMGLNPNVFKGERLSLMIFEEAGEFRKLIEGFEASLPCFRDGADQFGLPIVGGTGGNILSASADFMTMWYEHESYNLRQLFIPVTMCYKGFFDFTTGTSLIDKAKEHEEKQRKKLEGGNQTTYNLRIQNYPFVPEESFMKSSGSPFNLTIINEQSAKIMEDPILRGRVEEGYLDWDFDDDQKMEKVEGDNWRLKKKAYKQKVKFRKAKGGPVKILLHPILDDKGNHKYHNMDIGGIDSIDQDEAGSTDSKGASMIYRRFVNTDLAYNLPVAYIHFRSNRASEFYEMSMKLAVYYNAKMLVEYTKFKIIDYFIANGATKYLKEKPISVHERGTLTRNKFGVHMNRQIKETGIELMAEDIDTNGHEIWFLALLEELRKFGDVNTDIAMAYMLCQIHNFDISKVRVIKERAEEEKVEEYNFGSWINQGGKVIPVHR